MFEAIVVGGILRLILQLGNILFCLCYQEIL